MAQLEKWEHPLLSLNQEEEEEALSFSDLPVKSDSAPPGVHSTEPNSSTDPTDDFEFRISITGGLVSASSAASAALEADMCAADEVFFRGQLLPLRPSFGSRSDSLDHYTTTTARISRSTSSNSSRSGSYCVSRSHSSKSSSGNPPAAAPEPPRRSVSNNFYTFPSPSPQIRTRGRKSNVGPRRSTSSPAAILRLGVLPAPEIDLHELRPRRQSERMKVAEKKSMKFGYGFACKCSPETVVEPGGSPASRSKSAAAGDKKKKDERNTDLGFKRGESLCRTRIFDWLEELSIAKPTKL